MAYRIEAEETVEAAVQRIAREQIGKAVKEVEDESLDDHATVHEVRKRCKKIRGLLRLVRPVFPDYSKENAAFRDAARRLSGPRDATTLIESFDALVERFGGDPGVAAFAGVREALVDRRDSVADGEDLGDRLDDFRGAMVQARKRARRWSLDKEGFAAVGAGLGRTHKRARRAMEEAFDEPTTQRLHEWRKRVKYNRYHLRLLGRVWPPVMEPLRDEAKRLSDLLGDEHDLGILRGVLVEEPERFGHAGDMETLLSLVDRRREELRAWARPLGRRLYAEKRKTLADRVGRYWKAWRAEQRLADALREGSARVYS